MSEQRLLTLSADDIEPELLAEPTEAILVSSAALAALPDFPLRTLLTFLPDVRLKAELARKAAAALAIDVQAPGGLQQADAALGAIRDDIKGIALCFDGDKATPGPTALAHDLHKRLTGLRGDFLQAGEAALAEIGKRIYDETKRLERIAEQERRQRQIEADKIARETAARAAKEAAKAQAPAAVVAQLQQQAQVATAPPVSAVAPPALAHTATAALWKARLRGTLPGAEPHPETADMTEPQRLSFLQVIRAVFEGRAPLSLLSMNWTSADARAKADKGTLAIEGLEAFDAGSIRGKAKRS